MSTNTLKYFFTLLFFALPIQAQMNYFDWNTVLHMPPGANIKVGNQILHFNPSNKPYLKDATATKFVNTHLSQAKKVESDAEALKMASDLVCLDGAFIELGVCTGKTINFIAALNPHKKIFGFDSFEGLPEDWVRQDNTMPKGTFGYKNPMMLPPVLHNVVLIKGWFKETLPIFVQEYLKNTPIAFLHVDSDIYSSAITALKTLKNNIQEGTVIIFDEFYNYPGSEDHELKAFNEFLETINLQAKYCAFNINHEQVVVQMVNTANQIKKN
ncbi:TPA: hypothetical protein DEO28_01630 [Candidatus Dependentiae bacterium]|nr:MAG: hypothetical protein UR14_C0004G0015 [candidate division TM6 bacterium GW2011_GWE2_31_21]KKP52933.1 MAG: hypothetical protein UR43_C0008G0015 [candidate division TM6 bacterium GW2011_GWF2_33_332]HBS47826.1 hypothetical protein [Candidatus Dependentiae bacterium]HBZ73198.1 hypothetical protein [Candidatus Dependentiae bacterium]